MARLVSLLLGLLSIGIGVALFYIPNAYSFARHFYSQIFENNQSMGQFDNREQAVLAHVKATAALNDPQSVLDAIDKFAWSGTWLMNVGDVKGQFLDAELQKHKPRNVLELGTYVGYSAIRMASQLPEGGKLYTVDVSPENVEVAKEIIAHAGLSSRIEHLVGTLEQVVEDLKRRVPTFDMVFVDHDKAVYLSDLELLIQNGFLRKGSVVVADNVLIPGAPNYLKFVEEGPKFDTEKHYTRVEYTALPSLMNFMKDLVTVSVYKG